MSGHVNDPVTTNSIGTDNNQRVNLGHLDTLFTVVKLNNKYIDKIMTIVDRSLCNYIFYILWILTDFTTTGKYCAVYE